MNALVMFDRETESLWSQFLSQSVRGDLLGIKLETIPLTLTTWEKWKDLHPDTVALRKGRRGGDPYVGYYAGGSAGVIGQSNQDDRLPIKDLVLGLGFDGDPVAFPHSQLRGEQLVHTLHANKPVVVYFDPVTDTALAHDAVVNGKELSFEIIATVVSGCGRPDQLAVDPIHRAGCGRRTGGCCIGTFARNKRVLVRVERLLS